MKKLIICATILLGSFALNAYDCLREFQVDMVGAYETMFDEYENCESNWDTQGHCNREVQWQYSHNVGVAAKEYEDCMLHQGNPLGPGGN